MTNQANGHTRRLRAGWRNGAPVEIDSYRVAPRSWSLEAAFAHGAFVFNRPVGLIVNRGSDQSYEVIQDPTRRLQLVAYGLSIALVILGLLLPHGSGRQS